MTLQPVIKWTGTKRYVVEQLLEKFPKDFNLYYEPFLGGGSVGVAAVQKYSFKYLRVAPFYLTDNCKPLIDFWVLLRNDPESLVESYKENWKQIQKSGRIAYNNFRIDFNKTQDPKIFLLLSRTCYNGLIRFNKKGEFNSPFHFNRGGIKPEKLEVIINQWHNYIKTVNFVCCDYTEIYPSEDDFVFLDPPYGTGTHSAFDEDRFWSWLKKAPFRWMLTYDREPNVPFINSYSLRNTVSGFSKLKGKTNTEVREYFYTNY